MNNIKVTLNDEIIEIPRDTTVGELAAEHADQCSYPILIAQSGGELWEFHRTIKSDCNIKFLDLTSPEGYRVYQRSAVFLLLYAAKEILGRGTRVVVEHSINKNFYCEIDEPKVSLTAEVLEQIEAKMHEVVNSDIRIEKYSLPVNEGISLSTELELWDKVKSLQYRTTSNVNFYKLDWFYDYFYGTMAATTGVIKHFKLQKYNNGFMLVFPQMTNPEELMLVKDLPKISQIFSQSNQWARILKADTVGALNDIISDGGAGEFIRINEALHEKRIGTIADTISQQHKNIVLIAGPSSSGKTTFAHRLCIQLRVNGLHPHVISLDDYYVDRENSPRDEFGNFDFESLYAIDIEQFNSDLLDLLAGKTVNMPTFNFIVGKREYKGRKLRLNEDDILVIEGIHGLNEKLSHNVPKANKFKIFISALTQLNLDDHNRIPTSDTRLIRRMVRDNRMRGFNSKYTISMWDSVVRGESKNIFPFQEDADMVFNSALVYELCVLKQYAEPLLFSISPDEPEYTEARRLIKFLGCFIGIPAEDVPNNSLIREFIGGSCFH